MPVTFDHDTTGILPAVGDAERLSAEDFRAAAAELGVPSAAIRAVAEIESGGRIGFDAQRRPKILFEAHYFHKLTRGALDASHPHLSQPSWNDACRRYYRLDQWGRMYEALTLDADAALQSASWGMFQVLGSNYRLVGWSSVRAFVADMFRSEAQHLRAFLGFLRAKRLVDELRPPQDWARFARGYNGPGYAKNHYDTKLAAAYARWSALDPG